MKKHFKLIALLIVCSVLLTGCGGGKNSGVDDKINLNAPDNIKVESFYSTDKTTLILKLTNEGSEDIKDLDVLAKYPNSTEDLITEDEVFLKNFKANSTTYAALMLPIDSNFNSYIPSKIDLDILTEGESIEGIADTSEMVDLVKFDYNIDDNIINYTITNNTGKILGSISSIVVYFKDGKPIATDYIDSFDVKETYSSDREILYSEDDVEYIDYDNLEIYVTSILDDYVESDEGEYSAEENEMFDDEPIEEDDDMSWDE